MKVLYVVNSADAQSIPMELGLRLREQEPDFTVAGYYGVSSYPADHDAGEVLSMGARRALDPGAIFTLFKEVRRGRPDVIHVHHTVSALFCWLAWLSTLCRGRLVKTEHNDHRFLNWRQKALNLLLFPFCARIVCNSRSTQDSFSRIERLLAGARCSVFHNGVDIDRVIAGSRKMSICKGQADATLVVGHVGRLVPQKNQVRLVRALARARRQTGQDIRVEVIGDGALARELRRVAHEEGVSDTFLLLGPQSRAQVYAALSRWDAFIMPSLFEGFCNAIVEAMAAGLPVACSDIMTLREIAGPNTVRFPPDDIDEMARALIEIVQRPRGQDRQFAADRYAMKRAVVAHRALYRELGR